MAGGAETINREWRIKASGCGAPGRARVMGEGREEDGGYISSQEMKHAQVREGQVSLTSCYLNILSSWFVRHLYVSLWRLLRVLGPDMQDPRQKGKSHAPTEI